MNLEVFIMTAKELAEMLSGREYSMEISREEAQAAKEAGLVVAYGCSDDGVELRGAIDAELGAYEGTTIYIGKDGLVDDPACSDAENCTCPYFAVVRNAARAITVVWHDAGGPCWTFETDIPHETFTIMEDGEPFCEGIVFSMEGINKLEKSVPKTKYSPGDDVWIVERDEGGNACDMSGYMFLAEACGFAIVSCFINDLVTPEDTLAYMAENTAENYDTDVAVFPMADVYGEQADAKSALEALKGAGE